MNGLIQQDLKLTIGSEQTNNQAQRIMDLRNTAWLLLFRLLDLIDGEDQLNINENLTYGQLYDPDSEVSQGILFIYSLETFIPQTLNCEYSEDLEKTMGPFAYAFQEIILNANSERLDAEDGKFESYRGAQLTEE